MGNKLGAGGRVQSVKCPFFSGSSLLAPGSWLFASSPVRAVRRLFWAGILLLLLLPRERSALAASDVSPLVAPTGVPVGVPDYAATPGQTSQQGWFKDLRFAPPPASLGGASVLVESPVLSNPGGLIGLRQATPEDATLKIGNAYLKVLSVSGSMLYSDNINWTAMNPESGYIAILRLGAAAMYQINDNLQLAVGGSLVYLPTQGKFGLSGFGILDPLYAFSSQPLFRAQLSYDLTAGDWQILLANEYKVYAGIPYASGIGFQFNGADVAGNYVFDSPYSLYGTTNSFLMQQNTTGVSATRLLPTQTRLTLGASQAYYWYDGDTPWVLPTRRTTGYAALDSELEALRFKPFAFYQIDRYDLTSYNHHQVRGGVRGPVTENLFILIDGGYYWADGTGRAGPLWGISLGHTLGPVTEQYFGYGRYVVGEFGDLQTRLAYGLRHQLNSVVALGLEAHRNEYELLGGVGTSGSEWGASGQIQAAVMPEGEVALRLGWAHVTYAGTLPGTQDVWMGGLGFRYRSLQADAVCRWTNNDQVHRQYLENMVTFTLTKYF
jgi:hypothetical protein